MKRSGNLCLECWGSWKMREADVGDVGASHGVIDTRSSVTVQAPKLADCDRHGNRSVGPAWLHGNAGQKGFS